MFRKLFLRVGMAAILLSAQLGTVTSIAGADGTASPKLVVSQFKVTTSDGQYFTLFNPSSDTVLNLANYELEYFNNNDLTKATSSKIIPLAGSLAPQGYYMLSDGTATICYQQAVNTVSLGFSTTSGFVELLQLPDQTTAGTLVVPSVVDYVGWSKKTSSGNDTLSITPATTSVVVPSGTSITWLRKLPASNAGGSSWQSVRPDPANACSLQLVQSGAAPQPLSNPGNQLGVGQQPPATIVTLASSATDSGPSLPAADIGLATPQITELLPNPDGTGTDDSDEFIELYNPNPVAFHLIGFTLQTGTTTKHNYTFPDGAILAPQSFTAFYSADTNLSLSNSGGQADLLDPFGNLLSQTDPYSNAKDSQAWALANGMWYFTAQSTPNAPNVIKQTGSAKSSSSTKATATNNRTSSPAVKGATTTATSNGTASGGATNATAPTPIHPYMLAAVATLAVGYGVYEYRHDLANYFHQRRRNRAARRVARA